VPALCHNQLESPLNRRQALARCGAGFGSLALTSLLHEARATTSAEKKPHFEPRAKRVIFVFLHGGPSQVDTFDYKPSLQRDHGKPLPFPKPRIVSAKTGNLLASPFEFRRHGQSGAMVSSLFPEIAATMDDLCLVRSMHCSNSRHGGALLELHTGSDTFVRPSAGSWINYGLGTENDNLPGFITVDPTSGHGGANAWSSSFLPARYQGTVIRRKNGKPRIPFIENAHVPLERQRLELEFLTRLNRDALTRPDAELESRIESFELAFQMQMEVPQVQDLANEPAHIQRLYGMDQGKSKPFAESCVLARRYSEAGVRFVQITHRYWDDHGKIKEGHGKRAIEIDRPIAGLIKDLKQRGLLEDTLVVVGGEFGRTPVSQGSGRDHNPHGFSYLLAGGGIQPGLQYGQTDEYGFYAVENKVHFHDLHATMLHLLGFDHTKLTHRFGGRDFRLTDVHGRVVADLLG